MNWKYKSFFFSLINFFALNSLFIFIKNKIFKTPIKVIDSKWEKHLSIINDCDIKFSFEFGAGRDLRQNIYIALNNKTIYQFCFDRDRLANINSVNHAINSISNILKINSTTVENFSDLFSKFNINYIAPSNIGVDVNLDTFDLMLSTDTFEHIPVDELINLLRLIYNKSKIGCMYSIFIDYVDHYSYCDSSISKFHFLEYSDYDYKKYNHYLHFQNRLNHADYEKIFSDLGFEFIENIPTYNSDYIKPNLPIAGYFLLRKSI